MDFGEWLKAQRSRDPDYDMPYAPLYEVADELATTFGQMFDIPSMLLWIKEKHGAHETEYAEALVQAEANWRLDMLVMEEPAAMAKAAEEVVEAPSAPVVHVSSAPSAPPSMGVPTMRCGFMNVDGNQCGKNAVLGAARCAEHGGMILDPNIRQSLLVTAYAKMVTYQNVAVETLVDVMIDGRNDVARVQASKELLDRTGLTADLHKETLGIDKVEVEVPDEERRQRVMDLMRTKLDATRDRMNLISIPVESTEVEETG